MSTAPTNRERLEVLLATAQQTKEREALSDPDGWGFPIIMEFHREEGPVAIAFCPLDPIEQALMVASIGVAGFDCSAVLLIADLQTKDVGPVRPEDAPKVDWKKDPAVLDCLVATCFTAAGTTDYILAPYRVADGAVMWHDRIGDAAVGIEGRVPQAMDKAFNSETRTKFVASREMANAALDMVEGSISDEQRRFITDNTVTHFIGSMIDEVIIARCVKSDQVADLKADAAARGASIVDPCSFN
jgi:hypothetical protein